MREMTSAERGAMMAKVRSKNTLPERQVRQALSRMGVGYRLHRKSLPGSPDIVLAGRRKVIFVHGCYWHRHKGCRRASMPRTNEPFWRTKFERNVQRDGEALEGLRELGWSALVVWQCECQPGQSLERRIRDFLDISDADADRLGAGDRRAGTTHPLDAGPSSLALLE